MAPSKLVLTPVLTGALCGALRHVMRAAELLAVVMVEGSATIGDALNVIDLGRCYYAAIVEAGEAKRFLTQVARSEPLPPCRAMEG
jgi:hypothetical protein